MKYESEADQVETWYGTKYKKVNIPEETIKVTQINYIGWLYLKNIFFIKCTTVLERSRFLSGTKITRKK